MIDYFAKSQKNSGIVGLGTKIVALLLLSIIVACGKNTPETTSNSENAETVARLNTQLVLNNAVLEQSNRGGDIFWKIKSERTTYSDDKKIAYLDKITANLLQNSQLILQLSSEKGEVRDNGNLILLSGNIIAVDPRNQAVLKSDRAEWRPQENVLIIQENLQGSSANLKVQATTAKYFTDQENLELTGKVIASTIKPSLILETDRLLWQIPQQKIIGNTPWQVVRYEGDRITDKLIAEGGEVYLDKTTLNLSKNIEIISLNPQLQIATDFIQWNYHNRLVTTNKPIQVIDRERQLDVTGNQGQVNLATEIVTLKGGVKGINNRDRSTLYSQELTWDIPHNTVKAMGNVVYEQTKN